MEMKNVPRKNRGPILDPGLCRACRSIKKCRLLTAEYEWMGKKEIYSEMFMDVFGLLISNLDGEDKDSCICATCVLRLREANAFRLQVLQSEEVFLEAKLDDKESNIELRVEVKTERLGSDSEGNDSDNLPIQAFQNPSKDKSNNVDNLADDHLEENHNGTLTVCDQQGLNGSRENTDQPKKAKKPVKRKPTDKKTKKETKKKSKKEQQELDEEYMSFQNTVKVIHNSYAFPFHNRISNYYCYYCREQFINPIELREHTQQHDPVELFENTVENKKIPKLEITRIDCRLCDTKIDDINAFKSHITTQHNIKLYPVSNEFLKFKLTENNLKCTECDKTFPYFDALKKHMIEHFGTYVCDMCGTCFLERNSLRTHIKSHNKVPVNYPCEVCGKNLKSKYSRYLHVATIHEKKPTVNCYKCDASFLSHALRNRHLIEVHNDKRTFPCKQCDKVYNRRKTLMEHNRRHHLKVLRHQCPMCDQKFYLPSRLKEHLTSHSGDRTYRCQLCNKGYPRLQPLQDHIKTHADEKNFKCTLCAGAFAAHATYKHHLRHHHPGYQPNPAFTEIFKN